MAFYKLYPRDWNDEIWRGEPRSVLIVRAGSEAEARTLAGTWDRPSDHAEQAGWARRWTSPDITRCLELDADGRPEVLLAGRRRPAS
ncbi:hypothetical protein [Inquilinus limosus]|uniref:Uncharacterized protein n=1 Tax=Inquilinus limosus MP06 TaxID=1398085 RepID=A0A0A0CYF4_9PROT|nr:hypothetical protein [Inquilinus limosus]KGM30825.1 hypothetical protein P409_30765 [Inquilinus limosus MP06]